LAICVKAGRIRGKASFDDFRVCPGAPAHEPGARQIPLCPDRRAMAWVARQQGACGNKAHGLGATGATDVTQ